MRPVHWGSRGAWCLLSAPDVVDRPTRAFYVSACTFNEPCRPRLTNLVDLQILPKLNHNNTHVRTFTFTLTLSLARTYTLPLNQTWHPKPPLKLGLASFSWPSRSLFPSAIKLNLLQPPPHNNGYELVYTKHGPNPPGLVLGTVPLWLHLSLVPRHRTRPLNYS